MEVLSPSKRHAAVLEMVSDEEEEEGAQESEQEEGEICSEDEEEGAMEGEVPCPVFSNYSANATNSLPAYAPHFSFPDHRPNKTPSLATVASEVVIYDDKGRTAIFTSPKKPRISSYPRRGEASRQHARELPRRKEKEGERSRRHHSSSSLQTASEKWPKASWRSAMESRGAGPPQEGHVRPYRAKTKDVSGVRGGHRARKGRPPSPDSSSRSSSCSSCSSSSSSSLISCSPSEEENDVSTVSPCKGRGKENRRCGPAGKSHDRPHSQEYGCDPPPPAKESSKPLPQPPSHRPKHSGSQHGSSHHRPPATYSKGPRRRPSTHHNSRRSPKESTAGKAAHQQHQRTHQKPPKARPSERKDSSKVDKPVKEAESVPTIVKGQNRLPRGSLGEMLLSRPKAASTHPTPGLQDIPRPPGEDPKTPTSPAKPEMQQGEEKVVQEVILDSHTSSEGAENLTLDQEDDEELQLRLIAIQSSLRLLTDMQREGQTQEEAGIGEESCHTSSPLKKTGMKDEPQQEILNDLSVLKESRTPPVKDAGGQGSHTSPSRAGRAVEADAAVVQISDDISISSSSASEICSENLATNTSYLEEGGGGTGAEDSRRRGKERSDVDQDPVDMEICDSSGEEEGGQAMVVQDSPLSPEPGQDTGKAAPGEGPAGVSSSNFQIPVEWAYMMPPPPPPDQPANDLHNINSWCFDQNMYLQAMQVAPQDEQQQQQQGQAEAGQGTEWLAPAQPHASTPWPSPFMEAYDNNTLPQDTSSPLSLPMGLPPDQQQDQHQQQHPPEYAFSEPALPQHTSPPGQGSDLKDAPAEQYQAFMSAVLQQQQQQPSPKGRVPAAPAFTECPQRNLIMVPLSGSHQPTAAAAAKASKKVKAKVKKMRTKKRLRKKQVLQECSNSGSQQQMTSSSTGAAGAATAVEEEDEELLRAKLLIDMSRKKEQRLQGATTTTTPPTASTNAAPSASFPAPVNRTTTTAKEGQEGRASPQTLPQPSEALVPPRSLRVVKGHDGRPRSGESSPTHSFKGESRKGLSDIGGWGLDPKGSKFNYHSSTQHDFPLSGGSSSSLDITKVKFPTIQPIIISLQSDSDDSDEEGEGRGEGPSAEPMSHSIDILLKSMRNANMASTSKEVDPAIPKPGPSTRSTSPAAPSSPATKPREVADSTPQAVRHLSRHQQLEYRWLKEQLRKKEMLQRRKMLQRPLRAKLQPKLPPPPPPLAPTSPDIAQSSSQSSVGSPVHTDPSRLSSGSEGSPSTRAVTWKDIGLLQIQVSNDAALDLSSEGTDPGDRVREALDDSSASASAVEDDDEETLRMMALRTQKSKKSETQCRRVVVEGRVSENEGDTEAKDGEEEVSMETSSEEHLDEGLRGEWMVLDEVREEGTEVGEEELCARPPGSSADELKCGEGTETSDDEEAVIRYPSHALRKENQNTEQQVPRTTDEERTKEQTNKTNGKEAQIREGEAAQNTASATASSPSTVTPDQPASEGRSASQSDTDTKQQDPPVMPGVRQVSEPSCNKIIEEVIRRIENKTRVVRGEASRESSPVEVNRSSVPSQGSTKKQVSSQLPSKKETKTKLTSATQKLINLTPVTASHSGERESTLVKSSHSTTTSTTTTTSSVSLAGTVSRGAAGALNQSRAVVSNQNGGGGGVPQRTVLPSGTMQKVRRVQMVRPQSNTDSAGKDSASAAPTTSVTTAARAQDTDNPTKAQLKRVENEYKEKKSGINKMIVQLGQLLKEVSEEQQQQQEFKKSISELQTKLREMESQYEGKSSALQTKLKLIGHIQVQYRSERQVLRRLEHHGETLGKQVYGTGFSFKSLPVSPRSKVKDVSTKKTLASSIYALQQQVRDLTNKQKNSLKTSPNKATEAGVLRKQNTENNGLKTPPTNTTEAGMLRKQSTGNNGFKTPPANTTEAGVLRKQSIGNSGFKTPPANTTEAGVLRKQSTGNNGFKTPPANTTETGVLRKQNTADNLKTPPANTTETGVLKKQNTADNLKTPPANTTEAGVLRKQNTANNLKTPPANTTGRQDTADNFKTPPANTTERGVVRKQNTVDTTTETTPTTTTNSTIKTTSTTTTKQGEPERSTTKTLNLDAKNGTTVALEKVTVEASVKSATALHVQGVPSGAPHSRPPANTQGKDGTASPQGKPLPVKRKASATRQGGAKVARVQMPKEDQPSAVPERDGARLASRPTSAATNGAKEEDKLDEMKALCPHDLLGRCNDSSCQYQHLPAVRTAPQAQNSPSSSKEPRLSSRDDEPQTTTSTTIKQGKVVGRAGAKQVKVTSGSAVPSERSSEEVKSQLLPDTHVSEQQHQTQTVVENGTATTALEDSDTQPTSRTAAPTTEQTGTPNTTDTEMQASTPTDTHTTSQTAAPTTEQTGTPNTTTTDSEMQGRTPTDSHATSQTSAPTTEEQTGTPNTTTTTVTEMQQAPTDTPDTTDTRPYATQHQTDTDIKTTDEQTERPQAGTSVGNLTEATITDTDVESQTPTEPQETQTGTETSVQGWQTDKAASVEAPNAAVTEPQRETEASTAQPETPTCTRETENTESGTNEDAASLQTGTTSGSTETQTGAEDTEIDTETSASVSRELSDSSTMITESEGREWLPSDVESQASTTSSSDCLPLKHQPPKPSSRPAKRRASCRKSRESITEDAAPSQDLQSEGDTVNELQKTRGTRKSLRVKAKASPKGTPPPKKGAKPTTPGKGQKRKSESLSKHPSSKKRHATKP